jgi:hypothetical protein
LNDNLDNLDNSAKKKVSIIAEKAEFEEFDEASSKGNIYERQVNMLRDLQLNVFIELVSNKNAD